MKNVLAWCKSHLLVVICAALIIIVLPTSMVLSSMWNKSIRTKRQSQVESDYSKLKISVPYAVPSLDPAVPALTLTSVPNENITAFFAAERKKVMAQGDGVVKNAVSFNRRGHKALIEGQLPDSRGPDAAAKGWAFAELLVGTPNKPSIYQKLFADIGAGDPADAGLLAVQLQDTRQRLLIAKVGEGQGARQPTLEEDKEIAKQLRETRLGLYQSRAREISVYGGMESLGNDIPRAVPRTPPSNAQVFEWQADVWLIDDLLQVIKNANMNGGRATTIDAIDANTSSVVKRIERITFERGPWAPKPASSGEPEAEAPAAGSPDAPVTPDFKLSVSGRWAGPSNGVYDVRYAYLSLVVSASRLPQLIDAVGRTNFMTVVDCDLSEADVYSDLERGYYYGDEPVVRARLQIEGVYLRSWTTPLMPVDVKKRLGIAIPPADAPTDQESAEKQRASEEAAQASKAGGKK